MIFKEEAMKKQKEEEFNPDEYNRKCSEERRFEAFKFRQQHSGRCGACHWWDRYHPDYVIGCCEFNPPIIRFDKEGEPVQYWPEMFASNRCSNFKA